MLLACSFGSASGGEPLGHGRFHVQKPRGGPCTGMLGQQGYNKFAIAQEHGFHLLHCVRDVRQAEVYVFFEGSYFAVQRFGMRGPRYYGLRRSRTLAARDR